MDILQIGFVIVIVIAIIALSYFSILNKEDPCIGVIDSFKAWCGSCSIGNWPEADGATGTMISCVQKIYGKSISSCSSAKELCVQITGIS